MRHKTLLVVIISLGLILGSGAGLGVAARPSYSPGAAGVGDPYYPLDGNGGYDVRHYRLDVRYSPSSDRLVGVAAIRARATQDLSSFNLDLLGLTVRSVRVGGRPAQWSRSGGELTVTPRVGLRRHRVFKAVIRYDGVPETLPDYGGSGFIHTDDGALVIGEPHVASSWFPVNDHPSDKASYTFHVRVPRGLEAVSNGVLRGKHTRRGWTTWTWRAKEPMASYLATATIGQFDIHSYRANGLRFWDAVDPDLAPRTRRVIDGSFARQPEILAFLSRQFGPYPFSAAGGVVDDLEGVGFALENQTRPIYSKDFFTDPLSGDDVVVHELAHQWYGDSLAVERWRHIWLNEGFATYAEWLWSEREGLATAQQIFDAFYNQIPADDELWQLIIGDPGPDQLFDFPVYFRGAMTLHMLRRAVGDRDFFTILRRWAALHRGGNVSTSQFIALAERVSGQQLDSLFDAWLFTAGRPSLPAAAAAAARADKSGLAGGPVAARSLVHRYGQAVTAFAGAR